MDRRTAMIAAATLAVVPVAAKAACTQEIEPIQQAVGSAWLIAFANSGGDGVLALSRILAALAFVTSQAPK